jgi:hydrogenase maturation protein HypF
MDKHISRAERASIFHASLAGAIADQAKSLGNRYGISRIGLSGGVFQNRLLTEQAMMLLSNQGFDVYLHAEIPSGDGGISIGQLIEVAKRNAILTSIRLDIPAACQSLAP